MGICIVKKEAVKILTASKYLRSKSNYAHHLTTVTRLTAMPSSDVTFII